MKAESILTKSKRKYSRVSHCFGALSVRIAGVYYFPGDLRPTGSRGGKPFEIQAVYSSRGKWVQDTMYITQELRDTILKEVEQFKTQKNDTDN